MDEEDKQYKEKMKNTTQQFSEAAKDKAKKEIIKKIVTVLGAKGIAILILVVVGASLLTTVFLAAAVYFDDLDTKAKAATVKEKAIGNEALNTVLAMENGKYKIKYKNNEGKEVTGKEALQEILEDNDMNFEDFTDEEIECLYKCLKAEWATTYPDLGEKVDNADLDSEYVQGVITIKRGKSDGSQIDLTYKPYEEFTNIKDEDALKYFSIKDGSLVIANWSSVETKFEIEGNMPDDIKNQYKNTGEQLSITETSINYRDMIGIHTIPFELVISLLINTEDVDFVDNLADLAFNSTIELTVYDNTKVITTTVVEETEETTTYKKWADYRTDTKITIKDTIKNTKSSNNTSKNFTDEEVTPVSEEKQLKYKLTTTTIAKDNSYVVGLTSVKSWLGDISNKYTYKPPTGNEPEEDQGQTDFEPEEIELEEEKITSFSADEDIEKFRKNKEQNVKYIYPPSTEVERTITCTITNAKKQRHLTRKNKITSNKFKTEEYKYEAGTKTVANIGKSFKEVYDKHPKTEAQLENVSSWLFEMLEDTESTVDYVSIMKYLLYVCTEVSYGVTEEDLNDILDVMEIGDLEIAGSSNSFDQFVRYLRSWEAGAEAPVYKNDKGIECYKVLPDRRWRTSCRVWRRHSNTWKKDKIARI